MLATTLEPNDDFTTWTLTLRDGLVFSDGATFDAAAVQANWERAQDPANRPPAFPLASTIIDMQADGLTLTISLAEPNAHFDKAVERSSLNYIASPDAIDSGHDLSGDPSVRAHSCSRTGSATTGWCSCATPTGSTAPGPTSTA